MKLNKAKYKAALQGSSLGSGLKEACLKEITKLIRKSFGRNLQNVERCRLETF